ncbi:MAG: hypothetical protein RIB60_05125 [Phycisphaerales bacterium]
MNWKVIIGVPAIVIGSTLVVLAGFWVYRKIKGPPPPREPTKYDLDRIQWDFPTIIAATTAAIATTAGVGTLVINFPSSNAIHYVALLIVGVAWGLFLGVRWLVRKLAMPPSDEN